MSEDWSGVSTDVAQGLLEAGTTGYLVRKGAKTGPDYNPTYGPSTITAVKTVYSTWDSKEVDGTLIKATDQKILIEAGVIEPTVADTFSKTDGGDEMSIVSVRQIAPAGIPVLYILQYRE